MAYLVLDQYYSLSAKIILIIINKNNWKMLQKHRFIMPDDPVYRNSKTKNVNES